MSAVPASQSGSSIDIIIKKPIHIQYLLLVGLKWSKHIVVVYGIKKSFPSHLVPF